MKNSIGSFFTKCLTKRLDKNSIFVKEVLSEKQLASLLHLSRTQALAHLVADVLVSEECYNKDEASQIITDFLQEKDVAMFKSVQTDFELPQLLSMFENAKIPNVALKGAIIRTFYPEPWMRTSCDTDLLVKEDDLDRAKELLIQNSFEFVGRTSHDLQFISPSGAHLELHYDLIEDDSLPSASKILSKAWDHTINVEGCSYRKNFNNEFFCFYHIAHMAKHFLTGGCGARTILDYKMVKEHVDIDLEAYQRLLENGGLSYFEKGISKLCSVWFGSDEHDAVTKKLEEFILLGGVLGDVDNMVVVQNVKKGGKFKYLISRIFLPYDKMNKTYPILVKHKWLTPIFQVRRWFSFIFRGGVYKSKKELGAGKKITEEGLRETQSLLSVLGLEK